MRVHAWPCLASWVDGRSAEPRPARPGLEGSLARRTCPRWPGRPDAAGILRWRVCRSPRARLASASMIVSLRRGARRDRRACTVAGGSCAGDRPCIHACVRALRHARRRAGREDAAALPRRDVCGRAGVRADWTRTGDVRAPPSTGAARGGVRPPTPRLQACFRPSDTAPPRSSQLSQPVPSERARERRRRRRAPHASHTVRCLHARMHARIRWLAASRGSRLPACRTPQAPGPQLPGPRGAAGAGGVLALWGRPGL